MKEITDDELDGLRTQLSCCSPLVQSLVVRIDRVEEENVFLLNAMKDACKILGRNEPPETWEVNTLRAAAVNTASGNTALRERVKELENAVTTLHRSIAQADTNDALSNGVLYAQVLVECAQRIGKEFNLFDYWGRAALKEGE